MYEKQYVVPCDGYEKGTHYDCPEWVITGWLSRSERKKARCEFCKTQHNNIQRRNYYNRYERFTKV